MTPLKDQRLQIVVSDEFVRMVDDWRRKQPELMSRSEAIRRLVTSAIKEPRK